MGVCQGTNDKKSGRKNFNKPFISFYICKLSPRSTWFLLLLLKPLLCCFSAHLLDPDHSWLFSNTLNLYYTMAHARIFPFGGRKKSPNPPKPCGLVSCPAGLLFPRILFPSSKWLDRQRTNLWLTLNSQRTISKSEQTSSNRERKKNYFPDLEASSEWSPTLIPDGDVLRLRLWLSSRVEPRTVDSRPQFLSESVSKEKPRMGLLCSPKSSLFPGIKSSSLWGSLPWSR